MNIFDAFKNDIINAAVSVVREISNTAIDITEYNQSVVVEFPNNKEHGDISTNVAMVLAKPLHRSPRDIAALLYPKLQALPYVTKVEVAGPGFINIVIHMEFWYDLIVQVAKLGMKYGDSNIGQGERVNVEYVSANPTGPLHIGHARGAVIGQVMSSILQKCGYNVTQEYYINDAGGQIDTLIESFFIRYQQLLGYDVKLKDNCYPGEYLVDFAKEVVARDGDKFLQIEEHIAKKQLRSVVVDGMMKMIMEDLDLLGIQHDVFTSEQHDLIDKHKLDCAIEELKDTGLLYRGILDKPKGSIAEDWEPSEQLILKTTLFGDESDRPVLRSDGSMTYFSSDIAYHYDKLKRGFYHMIVPLGADHIGYAKRLEIIVDALSDRKAKLKVLIMQMVNLLRDGQPVKMSKRAGNFLTLREVIEELGADIFRFVILTKKSDTVLDIDFSIVREQSKDNFLFYIQYAHTRCVSVLRHAHRSGLITPEELNIIKNDINIQKEESGGSGIRCCEVSYICNIDLGSIDTKGTEKGDMMSDMVKKLAKQIAFMPRVLESAAMHYEPHKLVYYLYDLAHYLHQLWVMGISDDSMRLIQNDDPDLTRVRVLLAYTTASVIGNILILLGIQPVLEM